MVVPAQPPKDCPSEAQRKKGDGAAALGGSSHPSHQKPAGVSSGGRRRERLLEEGFLLHNLNMPRTIEAGTCTELVCC